MATQWCEGAVSGTQQAPGLLEVMQRSPGLLEEVLVLREGDE